VKSRAFWNIIPRSPLKINRPFKGTCNLHVVEEKAKENTSMTQVASQKATRIHNLQDRTIHNHLCERLRSYVQDLDITQIFH
jgi:hypothetical protein